MNVEELTLSGGITGESPSKPALKLVENGEWTVPPELRPFGWEKMPVGKKLEVKPEPVETPKPKHPWREEKAVPMIPQKTVKVGPREWNREELYQKVWTTPMDTLAGQYGISGNALAKTCRKLSVPVPGRGWWARKAAGQKVERTPLPPFKGKMSIPKSKPELAAPVDLPPIVLEPIKTVPLSQSMTKLCQIPVDKLCSDSLGSIEVWIDDKRTILRVWNPLRKEFAEFSGIHIPNCGEPK